MSIITTMIGSVSSEGSTPPIVLPSAWYSIYDDISITPTDYRYGEGTAVDSSGNVYVIGGDDNAGFPTLLKLSPGGSLIWQKTITLPGDQVYAVSGEGVMVDSNDDVIIVLRAGGTRTGHIIKLDSSANIIWNNYFENVQSVYECYLGPSNSVHGMFYGRFTGDIIYFKLDSSGNKVFAVALPVGYPAGSHPGFKVDSAGNIYGTGGAGLGLLYKIDSSGTFVYGYDGVVAPGSIPATFAIAVDNTGNSYCAGFQAPTSYSMPLIIKIDPSGTVLWTLSLDTTESGVLYDIDYDGTHLYAVGIAGTNNIFIVKLDVDGNIIWQRTFGSANYEGVWWDYGKNILSFNGDYYSITGYYGIDNNYSQITIQLPKDGSLTGTYGAMSYRITSFATSAQSISTTPSTGIFTTPATNAYQIGGATVENLSLSYTLTPIP